MCHSLHTQHTEGKLSICKGYQLSQKSRSLVRLCSNVEKGCRLIVGMICKKSRKAFVALSQRLKSQGWTKRRTLVREEYKRLVTPSADFWSWSRGTGLFAQVLVVPGWKNQVALAQHRSKVLVSTYRKYQEMRWLFAWLQVMARI